VHVATEGPLGWSAISAASRLGLPVTSDLHTNFDSYSKHYGVGWLQEAVRSYLRRFHNRTTTTFVPTSRMAEDLHKQGYRSVQVVSRGVDTTLFSPRKRSPELRAAWGLDGPSHDAPVLISVGRLAPEKNLLMMLRTYRRVRAVRPDARLVIVGDGPMRDAMARECPEAIMCGMRRGEDLAAHYASADLFLFPSLTETFGNVTLEAMASGLCPIAYDYAAAAEVIRNFDNGLVATPANAAAEVIRNFDNGLVATPGDEDAFIRLAALAAVEDASRDQMASAARHTAERYSWEQVNDAFAAALASAAAVAVPPGRASVAREDIQVAGSQ
jgi:glycosyltransferase involved in cell wall biosynthesis